MAALVARDAGLALDPVREDEPLGDAPWTQASGCIRTFPFDLKLEAPEWSGMDGFFAARLTRSN